ncbi:sigma E protease regulator RseP [Paraglaciecola psychrophila]|uniref:Zinc metalloprotease n=1 Tax=Paraglaciecola psychrophila 170 TaxID=1129794 RepID=K7AAF0_9ALTE|nr:sigma E protease regulator RseP [Paraglaciecola psychrophila]AGH46201.1 putative membrane-associated zinc metalloprotease [Paraglaciecola psychrophila 170]GAC39272.1 regulator of sigma E protease [Paraglaciecola psychrophila 170]
MSFLISLVSFIVALGILVAVHEWGHFWVARRCGVKVQRFSIGFGKALWRRTDKLGTEYVIAAIPLGGYVKMLDERVDEVSEEDLPYAFNRQHVLKRIAIIAAGPGVNFLFAIFALFVMYLIGLQTIKPVVGSIQPDSVFSQVNIPQNAILTQVGDRKVVDWEDVAYEFMSFIGHDEMQVKWTDEKTTFERSATINLSEWKFDPDKTSVFSSLGLIPFRPKVLNVLGSVQDGSAAQSIGFQANDKIVSLDGTSMQNWEQIVGYVSTRPNQTIEASVLRNEQVISLNGTIGSKTEEQTTKGYMGFTPTLEPWPEGVVFVHQYGVVKAMSKAMDKTWRLMTLSIEMLGKLITGDVSVKNLSGPISIAQGAGMSASLGLVYFLGFLALISVNLGIINLLPLPVLDGGHLLYYFIELFSGRPVPESVQEVGFKIGGVLLLLLMSIAIVNDIARL